MNFLKRFFQSKLTLPAGPCGSIQIGEKFVPLYMGQIGRITSAGFGVILDAEGKQYPFNFDAIDHYHHQTTTTLANNGFTIGQIVQFARIGQKVAFVKMNTEMPVPSSGAATAIP